MPSFKRPVGASGIVLALALVAAACSSGNAETTAAGDAQSSAETSSSSASSSTGDAAAGTESSAEPEAEPAVEVEGPSPVIEHSFPALGTVTISDGATVNLADELAGGDTPILLWFFAPH